VGFGVDPSSQRLLGQSDLAEGARIRRDFIRLLELLECLVVLALPAEINSASDRSLSGICLLSDSDATRENGG